MKTASAARGGGHPHLQEKNILKEFLEQHEKETVDMMKELCSQEEALKTECRIQRNEGFKKGQEKERENGIRNMVVTLSEYCGSEKIAEHLIKTYSLMPADAEEKVKKYLPERV